jgi:hypothetical protein
MHQTFDVRIHVLTSVQTHALRSEVICGVMLCQWVGSSKHFEGAQILVNAEKSHTHQYSITSKKT